MVSTSRMPFYLCLVVFRLMIFSPVVAVITGRSDGMISVLVNCALGGKSTPAYLVYVFVKKLGGILVPASY
ncbi:hypothetical protein GGS20DRAFT_552833 [Poronia punctata]|nr:hypothetical protein GGS20DRAFT_552833 [Poronia punctata]